MSAAPDDAIRFAEKVLALLDRGSFNATYKYAVLLGLMDLCLEMTQRDGSPPAMVTTAQLAQKVVALYWPQAAPFVVKDDVVLQQNKGSQAAIVGLIRDFRTWNGGDAGTTLYRAQLERPKEYSKLLREVEWKLVEMPLPRVQRVGQMEDRFVYQIAWEESIRRGEWSDESAFDNRIHFVDHAAELMVRLSGLLRPLIQREWSKMVARLNPALIQDSKLDNFLFGVSRAALQAVRDPLRELQDNSCFYCERDLGREVEVDHFMPWARYPDNGLDNLVITHRTCNNAKRDFLAASEHVARWSDRASTLSRQLEEIAQHCNWERDLVRTAGVIRGVYLRLPLDMKLWSKEREFVKPDPGLLSSVLA